MKNKNDFSFLISSFLTNYLTNVRNLSPNTVISYRDSIVFLLSYMNDVCNIKPEKLKKGQKNKWKIAQRKHIISVSGQTKSQVRELNI